MDLKSRQHLPPEHTDQNKGSLIHANQQNIDSHSLRTQDMHFRLCPKPPRYSSVVSVCHPYTMKIGPTSTPQPTWPLWCRSWYPDILSTWLNPIMKHQSRSSCWHWVTPCVSQMGRLSIISRPLSCHSLGNWQTVGRWELRISQTRSCDSETYCQCQVTREMAGMTVASERSLINTEDAWSEPEFYTRPLGFLTMRFTISIITEDGEENEQRYQNDGGLSTTATTAGSSTAPRRLMACNSWHGTKLFIALRSMEPNP